jgi:hypothetical protein
MEPLPKNRSLLVVHALAAGNYSLGSPSFAKPALGQAHRLATPDFTLGALDFGYDAPTLKQTHNLEPRRQRTGRPPGIPTQAMRNALIGQMADWLRDEQAKRPCHRLRPNDPTVRAYAEGLAKGAGVPVSYHILIEQVVRPALKRMRGS